MSHTSRPTSTSTAPRPSTNAPQKARQISHLQSQLAQLTANMADLESLVRMTAGQAQDMRGLGGYVGGMFMAASKVLGEETVSGGQGQGQDQDQSQGQGKRE